MIDLAIKNWLIPEKRELALEQLSNLEDYMIVNKSILKGTDNEELGGFFKELKEKNKEKKEEKKIAKEEKKELKKEKKNLKEKGTILNKLNKFNPATLTVRNAIRDCSCNKFFGLINNLIFKYFQCKRSQNKG
jgi:hypothetical protein